MDKEERNKLLGQQTDITAEIEQITKRLIEYGEQLVDLGTQLQDDPEHIIFADAPPGHGGRPSPRGHSYPWNGIPSAESLDQLIINLINAKRKLSDVQLRLRAMSM